MQNSVNNDFNKPYMEKWQVLLEILRAKQKVAIACSGGLDSRLLAYAAKNSGAKCRIFHISGIHVPADEENILNSFAESMNITIESYTLNPLEIKEIKENAITRCYFCKKAIFSFMLEKAGDYVLCDGSNTDDLNVYRPGIKALKELKISSPYLEADISKADIRAIAEELDLPIHSQPSQSCLLTRFKYHIEIEAESVLFIDWLERQLSSLIPHAYRVRGVGPKMFELHIENDKDDEDLLRQIETIFLHHTPDNPIPVIFMPSLRGYFDKSLGLQ